MTQTKCFDPWPLYSRYRLEGDEPALKSLLEEGLDAAAIQRMDSIWDALPWNVRFFGVPDYDYLQIEFFLENRMDSRVSWVRVMALGIMVSIILLVLGLPILSLFPLFIAGIIIFINQTIRSHSKRAIVLLERTRPEAIN